VLRESPALTDQFNTAVAQGHLQSIDILINQHAGGEYHPADGAICLSLESLATPPSNDFETGGVTFVLGHELQHALNQPDIAVANRDFEVTATAIARSRAERHDYTDAIAQRLAASRRDESVAEVAGWNAVVSAVKQGNLPPTLKNIYEQAPGRMMDFIDVDTSTSTYSLKPNLHLEPDLTISPSVENVETIGKNYVDKDRTKSKLGHLGNSDYVNYYGANTISYAAMLERHYNPPRHGIETPRMTVDMARLHLDERLLEENGIDLGRHREPMPYLDSSVAPAQLHHFDHTAETHTYVPIVGQQLASDAVSHGLSMGTAPSAESRFFPRTATDDFPDAYCSAAQRGDSVGCTALFDQHMQMPHMQAMQQQGRELYDADLLRQLTEQQRMQQEREQALQAQQQQQQQAQTRAMSL